MSDMFDNTHILELYSIGNCFLPAKSTNTFFNIVNNSCNLENLIRITFPFEEIIELEKRLIMGLLICNRRDEIPIYQYQINQYIQRFDKLK